MSQQQAPYKTVSKKELDDALEMIGIHQDELELPEGFNAPNHTQSPNDFYDYYLRQIDTLAELKVVCAFIRYTFGWHRTSFKMGIAKLAEYTGLSRKSVTDGAAAAEARKLLRRSNPGSKKEAEWELWVSRKLYASDAYSLRERRVNSKGQSPIKERIKKESKETNGARAPKAKTPVPKASDFPELVLHREVVGHWCKPFQREIIISAVQKISSRLHRAPTVDDLSPFFTAWAKVSGNDWSLVWLDDWAVKGSIPKNGKNNAAQSEPRGFEGVRRFLERHQTQEKENQNG